MPPATDWRAAAADAQRHRDHSIARLVPPLPEHLPPDWTVGLLNVTGCADAVLTPAERALTETGATRLAQQLATGAVTSVQVTRAFLRRAGLAQRLVNCITELLPETALARAQECDDYLRAHRKPMGPLHGLPVSVKESVGIKGLDLNSGFCAWYGSRADGNAWIVDSLLDAGCVLYARTTQPQTLMHLETSNNLYGVTVNPYNRNLTSGGSSGGEGALLGMRGSCLGIGTDIGGSIRSPAANCGVYGLRPTAGRLSFGGLSHMMSGAEHIMPVVGPMSTSLDGLGLLMEAALAKKPWLRDPSLVPLPWAASKAAEQHGSRRLKIGVLWDDGVVRPHPPVLHALRQTVDRLKEHADRFEVVDWQPHGHDEAWEIIASLYFADGGAEEIEAIEASGEPWRPLSRWILTNNPHVRRLSVPQLWEYIARRDAYRQMYAKLWLDTSTGLDDSGEPVGMVDAILCPVGPGAATPLDCARYWGYTSQWNLLDYPALVFPVTSVDPAVHVKDDSYVPRNEQDGYNYRLYDPELYRDAPVGLQLVGRRFEEEKVLLIGGEIEQALKSE